MRPIVWVSEALSGRLRKCLPVDANIVSSPEEFLAAKRDVTTPSFLDGTAIESLDRFASELGARAAEAPALELRRLISAVSVAPMIGMCDQPLATAIPWLPAHPWLSHLVSAALLDTPIAKVHLANVLTFCSAREGRLLDWLQPSGAADAGRRVRLTHAHRRGDRLARMTTFFTQQGVEPSVVSRLRDATEELLVNAFYVAPVAAGAAGSKFIERTANVALPDELACDIAYGCRDDLAIVRVRDPFGALSRERVVQALSSESGLSRVLAAASILAFSAVENRMTEVLVAIPTQTAHPASFALHFFSKGGARQGMWKLTDDDTGSGGGTSLNKSVTVTFIE